ncbi:ATP-dependent Clp protease proteolytic subunit [Chitinophaga sp. 22536]|uniref:ATP-dependent Clp protease proteolytic subunit n=1 Tax=unclassified Chitinophaga TaxID=2619133 RepID=UPI003F85A15E
MPFLYTVNAESDEPIMLINRHIGFDDEIGEGIRGDLFQQELLTLDGMGKKRIQVWINSPGGSVYEGYSIYNAILKSKTKIDTYCVGIAASMAAVVFQSGRTRYMADYSILMYHNPFNSKDPKDQSESLEQMRKSLVTMICNRSGMGQFECEAMMNRETFMDASEAFNLKLCDVIEQSADYNRKRLSGVASDQKMLWKEANAVINQYLFKPQSFKNQITKTTNMLKTTMALGLIEGVPEDAIVAAIKGIQDKAYNAEAEVVSLNKKLTDVENASKKSVEEKEAKIAELEDGLKKEKDELKKMKDELAAMKKEKEEAEASAKATEAKNMVMGFVAIGKIKNEDAAIKPWIAKGIEDLDGTKALLENLPLNRQAATIPVENKLGEKETKTTAASYAASLKASLRKEGRQV